MLFGRRPARLNFSKSLSRFIESRAVSRTERSRAAVASAAASAARHLIEPLETRVLLTTLTGGGQGQSTTFEYVDASAQVVRIVLQGDITAEFIGVRPKTTNTDTTPGAPPFVPAVDTPVNLVTFQQTQQTPPIKGVDLYAIYVSKADINSSISIAMVPSPTTVDRPMMPFSGSAGSFRITNGRTGETENISPGSQTGSVLLGARTTDTVPNTDDDQLNAISSVRLPRAFGVRPVSAKGRLDPGLVTAPGVSLGQFLFGGTVTGAVSIGGSINLFYAGQLWTGDLSGEIDGSFSTSPRNFQVAGDLRELVTSGAIGTNGLDQTGVTTLQPDLETGVDIRVGGRLGEVLSKDAYVAALAVTHDPKVRGPGTDQHELEVHGAARTNSQSFFQGDPFSSDPRKVAPSLGDSALFDNNSPATAQFLGTAFASNVGKGTDDIIHLDGELDDVTRPQSPADRVDYYAVALIAGQTIQLKTTSSLLGSAQQLTLGRITTGLFDPEGRLVASDYNNGKDETETLERAFRFTAKEPGVYRIAIGAIGDSNFNGQLDAGESQTDVGQIEYTLDVTHVADIALGGIVATGSVAFLDPALSVDVANGDLGAIVSTGAGSDQNSIFADETEVPAIDVHAGNLRSMEAQSIGLIVNNTPVFGPDLLVPRGIVGLLRGSGPDDTTQTVAVNLNYTDIGTAANPATAVGLDYQMIDAEGGFDSNLVADRGIGVVRASSIGTINFAPRIAANADARGNDGFIDEIDCAGHFGTLAAGGPQISVGPGGNVRYLHADDPTLVFRDRFFGGGFDNLIQTSAGKAYNFTDDSGTPVKITPIGGSVTTTDETGATVTETVNPGLNLLSYGIRGSGGSVLMYLQTTVGTDEGSVPQTIQVDSLSNGGAGSIEIGEIDVLTSGAPVTFDPVTRAFTTAAVGNANIVFRGRRTIDVFDIVGTNLNNVENDTDGEIVNLSAESLGTLSATTIGIGKSHTGTDIQSVDIKSDIFPFNANRSLIDVTGDAATIRSRKQLGNIQVGGTIGTLAANYDKANDKNLFEGIVAPVVAGAVTADDGNILSVDIGEGLANSGTGGFEQGGIFATGSIVSIVNQGEGSDIRGDIVAEGNDALPAVATTDANGFVIHRADGVNGIGEIDLVGGAIINADVMNVAVFTDALETSVEPVILADSAGIGDLNITNGGGIIGAVIASPGGGNITISHGFGIIDSLFDFAATTTFGTIDTDGYGIRSSSFDGGDTIGRINVRGDGKVISTESYTSSVRESEGGTGFDNNTGQTLGDFNDLHTFLGTSKTKPKNSSTSIAGSIDDTLISGAQNLGSLSAYEIRGTLQSSSDPTMRISFAQSVGSFIVTNNVDGLDFTAGTVKLFQVGKDTSNTNFTASGLVSSIVSGGNLKASTVINIEGTEGRLKSLTTKRAMNASVNVATKIDMIHVGTDLGSLSLNSSNDIGTVIIDGSILGGATLRAADQIASLNIGKNVNLGGTVRAKRISAQNIKGAVRGNIITG